MKEILYLRVLLTPLVTVVTLVCAKFASKPQTCRLHYLQTFHEKVLAKADVIQATGDAIVTFEEVAILTPR